MFPSGATFLCPDWKSERLQRGTGPAVEVFRRVVLPRLFKQPGVFAGTPSVRARMRTVLYEGRGAGSVDLALEATLDRIMPMLHAPEGGQATWLRREDILVRYRPEPALRLLVMMDTSLSMSGPHRVLAAVIGAVLAKESPSGGLGLIVFHSEPKVLIHFGEGVKPLDAAYRVLASSVGGITNISAALQRGLSMLAGCRNRSAHAVLITDGERTAGSDPCDEAKRFKRLHVVLVGRRNVDSSRELARLGKGLWRKVDSLAEVPPLLLRLLQRLCKD